MTDAPLRTRPWVIRLATTLVAWAVAFLIVLVLLVLLGHELESLPYALNALVFTGVLVPIMGNLVMPFVSVAVARRLTTTPDRGSSPAGQSGVNTRSSWSSVRPERR